MYFQMGSAAMDALKYSNYMSGLYGSMATSGTTNTDPTNTTSTGNKSPYSQMQPQDSSATGLSPKSPYESNNGSANSNPLKSNYSADSLSRSYFDGSRYVNFLSYPIIIYITFIIHLVTNLRHFSDTRPNLTHQIQWEVTQEVGLQLSHPMQ